MRFPEMQQIHAVEDPVLLFGTVVCTGKLLPEQVHHVFCQLAALFAVGLYQHDGGNVAEQYALRLHLEEGSSTIGAWQLTVLFQESEKYSFHM